MPKKAGQIIKNIVSTLLYLSPALLLLRSAVYTIGMYFIFITPKLGDMGMSQTPETVPFILSGCALFVVSLFGIIFYFHKVISKKPLNKIVFFSIFAVLSLIYTPIYYYSYDNAISSVYLEDEDMRYKNRILKWTDNCLDNCEIIQKMEESNKHE